MTAEEQWLPVPGTAGRYEVSSLGRFRCIYKSCVRVREGCIRKPGYRTVSVNGRQAFRHVLVARTFHGEPLPGQEVRHLNGVAGDDRPENLRWGTHAENVQDSLRHGTHNMSRKTECKWGHEFTEANTFIDNLGRRICRECKAKHTRDTVEKIARKRRTERLTRQYAEPDRQILASLPDGSWITYYSQKHSYYREWPIAMSRNRVGLSAAEALPMVNAEMEQAA